MSLISFLKSKTMQENFKEKFPMPKFDLDGPILASPVTTHYALVGVAFDYLLRFYTQRIFPKSEIREWVAEEAVKRIKYHSGNYVKIEGEVIPFNRNESAYDQFPNISGVGFCDYSKVWANAVEPAEKIIKDAKIRQEKFNQTGELTDELIESTLKLAQLDVVVRANELYISDPISKDDVEDLRKLFDVLESSDIFEDIQTVSLNPDFGEGSKLVMGADADLIVDDTLIDVKVTKNLKFTRTYYNQIIGYYALSRIENTFGEIKNIGVYFARHGLLFKIPISDVGEPVDFEVVLEWFDAESKRISKMQRDNMHIKIDPVLLYEPEKPKKGFLSSLFKR